MHVYRNHGGVWSLEQKLDPFPECVEGFYTGDVAIDGDRIAVSAPTDSHRFPGGTVMTWRYREDVASWVEESRREEAQQAHA